MPEPRNAEELDRGSSPRRGHDVHTVVLDGEAVLLDERENHLHVLNHTATLLWQLYDGSTTLEALASEISDELGLDHEAIVADLVAMTRHLAQEGLLYGWERTVGEAGA
jgi:hypothetical protein